MDNVKKRLDALKQLGFGRLTIASECGISLITTDKIINGGDYSNKTAKKVREGFQKMYALRQAQLEAMGRLL